MMLDRQIVELSNAVGLWLSYNNQILTTVESCTGGGLAYAITQIAGSSAWFDRGFITYSNQSKCELVDVDMSAIKSHGAVSEQVAKQMAIGALKAAKNATIALSVTGVAGPGGGSQEKPVGTVCFAKAQDQRVITQRCHFSGDRDQVRLESINYMLSKLVYL